MNLKEIRELIDLVSEKGFAEFEIERKGFRLRICRFKEPLPAGIQSATPVIVSSAASVPFELPPGNTGTPSEVSGSESAANQAASTAAESAKPEQPLHVIKSPIVGTFYRSPSPTADVFVSVGDQVEPDSVVCIIEAMKLMNEIQAEVSGEVVKVFVENGQPVEYGQPLFGIRK
jgi:acetyl-CoA carboxylase biotin carboxyl carrier protein